MSSNSLHSDLLARQLVASRGGRRLWSVRRIDTKLPRQSWKLKKTNTVLSNAEGVFGGLDMYLSEKYLVLCEVVQLHSGCWEAF